MNKIKKYVNSLKLNLKNVKTNSLKINIWLFLIAFSIFILCFLWLFQIVFLNSYYKSYKTGELDKAATELRESTILDSQTIEDIAQKRDLCIEIYGTDTYFSTISNKGCMEFGNRNFKVKQDFIKSNLLEQHYSLINEKFENETLIYALKLDQELYAFINASLEPLDSTITILSNQFIITSIIVLVLSLIIGYFISRKLSKPIIKISDESKKLADGNFSANFKTKSDIYEINELADSLNYAKEELSKTESLKRDLMANVSHDLKTPLTMIKAYAEMVRDITYNNKEKREENLNTIIEETDRLTLLVNDILDLSAAQSDNLNLNIEEIDLIELINEVIKRFKILSEQEDYKFIFNHPDKVIIHADYKRIYQVIYNLMNNAINYTGNDKKVYIDITEDKHKYTVSIRDTGKGIKQEDLKHIWDKYYHNEKKHKRNNFGTGLGLSIVKNILQMHNYKYGVTSSDKGSTFYFEIEKDN